MRLLLLIGLGSALGGMFRHGLSGLIARRMEEVFPWGTLTVNVVGSLLIGLLAGLHETARLPLSPEARGFLIIGVLGGFTTFSSFSLQTLQRLHDGDWWRAGANVVLSIVMCLAAVALGYGLARMAE